MNQPEPHNPSPESNPEELSRQPVTKADMLEMRSEISAMNDLLARIATAVEAPGIAEATRKAQEAEHVRQMSKAAARGETGHISG